MSADTAKTGNIWLNSDGMLVIYPGQRKNYEAYLKDKEVFTLRSKILISASTLSTVLDWDRYNLFIVTVSSSTTFSIDSARPDSDFVIVLKKDATGSSYNLTWPSSVTWLISPILAMTVANQEIVLQVSYYDGVFRVGYFAGQVSTLSSIERGVKLFGAVGNGVANDTSAFTFADAAGDILVTAGTYRITSSITINNNILFEQNAKISIDTGVVVTFNGDVKGHLKQMFLGLGSVVLAGQRSDVLLEWWGAVSNGSTLCSTAFTKLNAACTNGARVVGLDGTYVFNAAVAITNKIDFIGAGWGSNPSVGGTLFTTTTAFATSGSTNALFTFSTGSTFWQNLLIVGAYTTSTAQNYVAIRTVSGAGSTRFTDINVQGAGICWDLVACAGGTLNNCNAYFFSTAGFSFGGVANFYSGPWRIFGGIVNNPNATTFTSAATVTGNTLTFSSTAGMSIGMGLAANNIPIGATITGLTSTTATLSVSVIATVPINAPVRYGWYIVGKCMLFKGNAFDIETTSQEIAGGDTLISIVGSTAGAGMYLPNALKFVSLNATASTYYGIYVEKGLNIKFVGGHIGDVPFGSVVQMQGNPTAADLEGVEFNFTEIGGGGFYGIYATNFTNLLLKGCSVLANSLSASNVYNSVYCGASSLGQLQVTDCIITNSLLFSSQGIAAYALQLETGSFTGGRVLINGNMLQGISGGLLDGSAPSGSMKVVANNTLT